MSDPHDYLDFYEGPTSEYDELIDELKDALSKQVKTEITDRLAKLTKENAEQRAKLRDLDKLTEEARRVKALYEVEVQTGRREGERAFRKTKLSELLAVLDEHLYMLESKPFRWPKCDNCDPERRLNYQTPSGKDAYEMCECAVTRYIWVPIEAVAHEVNIRDSQYTVWWTGRTRDGDRSDIYPQVLKRWAEASAEDRESKQLGGFSFPDAATAQAVADARNQPIPEGMTPVTSVW